MSNDGRSFSNDITGEHKNTINKVSASAKNTLRCLNTAPVHFLLKCNKKEIKSNHNTNHRKENITMNKCKHRQTA